MHIFGDLGSWEVAALGCLKILPDICLETVSEIKEILKVASNLRKMWAIATTAPPCRVVL
jgi:hypothetical protein